MDALAPSRRPTYVLSVLANAPALHGALVDTGVLDVPHSPLWCRAHLHHRWRLTFTSDGGRFRRCAACGMDDGRVDRTGTGDG